jgi:ATP-dependent Clp protease ATP-binding subunit ClpX
MYGVPRITPRALKDHLDAFVVGQDRAKKVLATATYNHYQRIQEIQRREDEAEEYFRRQEIQSHIIRHPVEDEFPGQQSTINVNSSSTSASPPHIRPSNAPPSIIDRSPLVIEKSNVLILGPSGVGKTLMTKTLARVLDVPCSTSDCTPFTQAGYIGEDAEVCVQRLLAAADYDVARAERGIIVLDEIDKIATAKVSHGKDVSGEGVQQALLKIIEGTTVQVQAKQERGRPAGGNGGAESSPASTASGGGGGAGRPQTTVPTSTFGSQQQPGKGDVYNVNTDNILFICTGAFIGLHKTIRERISKGSMGFGAAVRAAPGKDNADANDPTVKVGNKADDELFRKHLPFSSPPSTSSRQVTPLNDLDDPPTHNTLDLTTPTDLHRYGLIPELVGRLPILCSLSPLPLSALVRVLTEPRNALLSQYTTLFALSNIELRLSTAALWEVARQAKAMGTGARGLRTVMESVLMESMFECPGSGVRYCFVSEKAVQREEAVKSWGREGRIEWHGAWEREEEEWAVKAGGGRNATVQGQVQDLGETFSQYRERAMSGSG